MNRDPVLDQPLLDELRGGLRAQAELGPVQARLVALEVEFAAQREHLLALLELVVVAELLGLARVEGLHLQVDVVDLLLDGLHLVVDQLGLLLQRLGGLVQEGGLLEDALQVDHRRLVVGGVAAAQAGGQQDGEDERGSHAWLLAVWGRRLTPEGPQ